MNATLVAPTDAVSMISSAAVVSAQSGQYLDAGDHRGHILISSAQSGGDFMLFEMTVDFQGGPPPHVHEREDETFVVQEGYFEVVLGDQVFKVGTGDTVFAPRGVPHVWRCISQEGGRLLGLSTPGKNFEDFFTQMCESGLLKLPLEKGIPQLIALSQRHGIQVLPPSHATHSS